MSSKTFFTKDPVILLVAVICTMLWGSAMPMIKTGYALFAIAESDVASKLVFAGVRFFSSGVLTLLIGSLMTRKPMLPGRGRVFGVVKLGLLMTGLQYFFFYIGVANTAGVKSSILNATATFLVVLLAHFVYRDDRLNRQKVLGCALGFAGVVLILLSGGELNGGFSLMGEGFVILAAASFAVGTLYSKQISKGADPMMITGWHLLIGGGALLVVGLLFGGRLTGFTPLGFACLCYLVLLSSVAFTGWTTLLKHNRMTKVSVYNFLTPVFGVLCSGLLLGERLLTPQNLLALVFVCAGIFIVNRPARPTAAKTAA